MKKLVLVLTFSLFLLLNGAEIKKVTSIGFGETPEKALDNALREGLAKVVGMYMSSSTFVKNYQTINDEITSFSNGYIENYSVTSTSKDEGGLVEVNVDMSVKTGILITKLKELNIATISVSVNKENIEKDLKMQNITKVNQEKLAEEYYKQIVEPIKLNKSHSIKINNFKAYEITDIVGSVVSMKDLKTEETSEFEMRIPPKESDKYDFMDSWYVIKVNYEFGITEKYYNNCLSFMNAAFKKIEGNNKISELDGNDKIVLTSVSSLIKTGMIDNVYQLDGRTLHKIRKFINGNNKYNSYSLDYKFKAYDKDGFPCLSFNDNTFKGIGDQRNIMRFEVVPDPRNLKIPISKNTIIDPDDKRHNWEFEKKEILCNGVISADMFTKMYRNTFPMGRDNLNIINEDYGLSFNVYLAVPKTKITEIAEIKGELTTK